MITTPIFFALGLIPYSVDMLLTKTFYSLQDTRTPMIINCFVVAVNIAANLVFFRWLGVRGLALGFTTAYVFSMLLDGTVLRLRLGRVGGRKILVTLAKALAAGGVMALVIFAARNLVEELHPHTGLLRDLFLMAVPMLLGLTVYFFTAHALRMEELEAVLEMASRVLRRPLRRERPGGPSAGNADSRKPRA